jgi:hypothetical protein
MADAGALQTYRQTLSVWQRWATQHPRESEHFFDDDRKAWR